MFRQKKRIKMISFLCLIVFCSLSFAFCSSAASVVDAVGLVAAYDKNGEVQSSWDGAIFTDRENIYTVIAEEWLSSGDVFRFISPTTGEFFWLDYLMKDETTGLALFSVEGNPSVALPLADNTSSGGDAYVVFYNGNTKEMDSEYVEIKGIAAQGAVLELGELSYDVCSGAAIVDESGSLIGIYLETSNGALGVATTYLRAVFSSDTSEGSSGTAGSSATEDRERSEQPDTKEGNDSTGNSERSNNSDDDNASFATVLFAVLFACGIGALIFFFVRSKKNGTNEVLLPQESPAPSGASSGEQNLNAPASAGTNRICIRGQSGYFTGQKFELVGSLTLGRQPERCNLCYPADEKGVSGLHCRLQPCAGEIELIDLGSSYGTFVNGNAVSPNIPVLLHVGDRFWLASENNSFVVYK